MRLLDKPHCKKHEVYQQNCIGCRIKMKRYAVPIQFDKGFNTMDTNSRLDKRPKLYTKNIKENPDGTISPRDPHKTAGYTTKPDHTEKAKKLLKAIYNDGAYGIRRNLQEDLETITRLLT